MPRFFLEVSYKGANYSGFQSQHNANTVQAEIEKAFATLQRAEVTLVASSRTDAGVHALQNFFHVDLPEELVWGRAGDERRFVYKMNAILPDDIVLEKVWAVGEQAHCRFDAIGREYRYYVYGHKDPFLKERAFYFPYKLDIRKMEEAAGIIMEYTDFTSFSKRNTQVKTFNCRVMESGWSREGACLVYRVRANRFLRGMVRGLTATMLKIGRGKLQLEEFRGVIEAKDCTRASFSVPGQGLFLVGVEYPAGYFGEGGEGVDKRTGLRGGHLGEKE